MSRVRVLQAREAAQSSTRLEEDGVVDQSVSVSESPEDKMDRRFQRILHASAVRVDLRGQAIESESGPDPENVVWWG